MSEAVIQQSKYPDNSRGEAEAVVMSEECCPTAEHTFEDLILVLP